MTDTLTRCLASSSPLLKKAAAYGTVVYHVIATPLLHNNGNKVQVKKRMQADDEKLILNELGPNEHFVQ